MKNIKSINKTITKEMLFALDGFSRKHNWKTGGFCIELNSKEIKTYKSHRLFFSEYINVNQIKNSDLFRIEHSKYFWAFTDSEEKDLYSNTLSDLKKQISKRK